MIELLKRTFKKIFLIKSIDNFNSKKNISNLVGKKIIQNIKINKTITEFNDKKFIFVLQPTLINSGPQTDIDKKIFEGSKYYKNINMYEEFNKYYNLIKNDMNNINNFDKDNFLDLSNVFINKEEQFFIDAVHVGDNGQKKIAEEIGKKIISIESKEKIK